MKWGAPVWWFQLTAKIVRPPVESCRQLNGLRGRQFLSAPDGSPLTMADLPPTGAQRWVARKKAIVVIAVRGGLLTMDEACERYRLSVDEFISWQRDM